MRIAKVFLVICLSFLMTKPITADNFELLQPRHQTILSNLSQRDYLMVEKELQTIRSKDSELFKINNYDYLLGRLQEKRSDFTAATKSFNAVITQNSLLSEYAYWHLALIAREQKDLNLEREQLKKLVNQYPNSLLNSKATRRIAEINLLKKDLPNALQYFRSQANRSTTKGREALGQVALIQMQQGQNQAARTIFEQLLNGSKDDQALLAAQKLDELDKQENRQATETELLTRGRVCLFNRDSQNTRVAYQELLKRFPASTSLAEAIFSIGRSYYIDYDYVNALKWYDQAYSEFPATKQAELALYQGGHAYQNMGRYAEAVARYQKLINEYPSSSSIDGAHLNIIDSYRSAAKYEDALDWCRRTQKRFSSDVTGVTALFNQAKIYLTKNDYSQALSVLSDLLTYNLSRKAPGSTNYSEVKFLQAYCLEKLGRINDAVESYLAFPADLNSYYSNRATLRLETLKRDGKSKTIINEKYVAFLANAKQQLANRNYSSAKDAINQALRLSDSRASQELLGMLRECYQNLPGYERFLSNGLSPAGRSFLTNRLQTTASHRVLADELIFLGLYDEGALELSASGGLNLAGNSLDIESIDLNALEMNETEPTTQFVNISTQRRRSKTTAKPVVKTTTKGSSSYSLAVYLNRGSHANPAIRYGESTFASVLPKDFRLELLDRNIAELIYPAPYRDEMVKVGQAENVDARFMLGIARQESRFDIDAKSPAAARGMFQFIASTAERISKELKHPDFNQNDLYLPPIAVKFGGCYLGILFDEFKDNPYAVAASYNGGEASVRRWIARSQSSDVDQFVIEIAYHESKDYVYKVMNNYWAYKQLYKEDLTVRDR